MPVGSTPIDKYKEGPFREERHTTLPEAPNVSGASAFLWCTKGMSTLEEKVASFRTKLEADVKEAWFGVLAAANVSPGSIDKFTATHRKAKKILEDFDATFGTTPEPQTTEGG